MSKCLKSNSTLTELSLTTSIETVLKIKDKLAKNKGMQFYFTQLQAGATFKIHFATTHGLPELNMFWNGPIQWENIPRYLSEMLEMVLICLKEIGCPEDLKTLLIKFFGPAFKIICMNPSNEAIDVDSFRPTKRQKTE